MKQLIALILSILLILSVLVSCGEQTPAEEGSSGSLSSQSGEQASSDESSEPETEPPTDAPETSRFEYEYVAPEDGSFTICGVPLEEYTFILYFPGTENYMKMDRKSIVGSIESSVLNATGLDMPIKVVKNERMFENAEYEHEILFGQGFVRDGKPETETWSNCYGVTENGTVYFSSPSPALYPYLWDLFLAEFFGVPEQSGAASAGCALTPFFRVLPKFDYDRLEAMGYSLVFEDDFEGTELDTDKWLMSPQTVHYTTYPGNVSVHDGILSLFGTWVSDTEIGEGWFGADLGVSTMYRYGYFEASVKCSYIEKRGTGDFWSAFWIQATDPYTPEQSQGGIGPGGMELDIMENFGQDYTTCCFWSAGVEGREGLVNELYQICDTGKNYHDEFHTYSLLWDEEAYSVFVDGVLIAHTDYYYGTARVPEEVRLTLCPRNGSNYEKDDTREMCVDYVRIWQKPDSEAVGSGS